jgi:uncharacterized protein YecE (DUF72 family)
VERLLEFIGSIDLGKRFALEIRNPGLLGDDAACRGLQDVATLVSVDSPDFRERIFPGDEIYLRMHGREAWYDYDYSRRELEAIAATIREIDPSRAYIFFNNDTAMLENALGMREILKT